MSCGCAIVSGLEVLYHKLASPHNNDVELLTKLRRILSGLQALLRDAENKQASEDPSVSQFLNELRDAVDSAENFIEEVNYEVLRLKVETGNQQVSDLNLSDDFFGKIKEKLEKTTKTLENLENQIVCLGLKEHLVSTKQEPRKPTTSLVDESDVFGRENEINDLIGRLLSKDAKGKNLTVIPIVGMGGSGKTTLAQVVYSDEKVKAHFGLRAWFCVSEAYDAFRITKGLLQEIGFTDCSNDNLNQLQIKLKESLKGKKFLLVLDDVWNEKYDEWDDLRKIFVQGGMGSKIIVTTRKENVALMMACGPILNVGTLSDEDSWRLFEKHSLENRNLEEHEELKEVGKQIAAKCKGLPLALKALAGILRSKTEVNEWRDVLTSEIWELPSGLNGILPALMLSYNDLPSHLKQCFAYCAIYPKDYQFCKDQVIHLWIANGLVQQLHSGNQYFLELRSRSLFERVLESSERYVEEYSMHDLVNDLAHMASSKLCIRLEESEGSHMLKQSRHMSYSMGKGGDFEKLKPLTESELLRTLLPINIKGGYFMNLSKRVLYNILPRLTYLRALSLSQYWIGELPNDLFIKLKLLRFLDLSGTKVKKLPDSICALYNLETLLLSSCEYLEELPLQMEKLINLRHLDISENSRLKMPLHLSKLKSLQVLVGAKFLLGGSRMEDFGELHNLYGSLSILGLQNVVDGREALKANMRAKEHVEKLSLKWSKRIAYNSRTERDILDKLQPHKNIKELEISGYRGTQFPNWLADHLHLELLVELSLSNYKYCYYLPALGQLPSLKFLSVRGMQGITEVTEEFYGSLSSEKPPFNSLEKLEFEDMPEWKQWHVLGNGEFSTLEKLSINNCPKLIERLPENLCSLTELSISKCPEINLETPIQLPSLKELVVDGCPKVGVLFDEAEQFTSQLGGMKQIDVLSIRDCNSLTSLPFSILPTTLKRIEIYGCRELKLEAPVGYCNMFLEVLRLEGCDCIDDISPELVPRARKLRVDCCQNLTRFSIPTETESLYVMSCENVVEILWMACGTQMTSLIIHKCKKLKRLPEGMQELLPSLKQLYLEYCPEIESFPQGGLPFNLQLLYIWDCEKLVNNRKEWHLERLLPCLKELLIEHDGSDEEIVAGENWELPCTIRRLTIWNLKTLSSQVLRSLTSLEYLSISSSPGIESLLEQGLPSSLCELTQGLRNLTSLQRLDISFCNQLQSLAELALPSSLSHLYIMKCPNLKSLPVKGMPSSLSVLYISECPLLEAVLEYEKGEYWPNIAHIPTILIDWHEYL